MFPKARRWGLLSNTWHCIIFLKTRFFHKASTLTIASKSLKFFMDIRHLILLLKAWRLLDNLTLIFTLKISKFSRKLDTQSCIQLLNTSCENSTLNFVLKKLDVFTIIWHCILLSKVRCFSWEIETKLYFEKLAVFHKNSTLIFSLRNSFISWNLNTEFCFEKTDVFMKIRHWVLLSKDRCF